MPSSLIIVALAAAWLVVLVPMVARRRQEIARTGEDALAARVVRSGSARTDEREESTMPESADEMGRRVDVGDELDADEERADEPAAEDFAEYEDDEYPSSAGSDRRYRPGRGGFDPEAAEIAARAKYAFRQRVVVSLLATVLITALLAGFVLSILWWITGLAIAALVGYLGYLRRQVRIENEIRRRRTARLRGARAAARRRRYEEDLGNYQDDYEPSYEEEYEYERVEAERRAIAGVERKPRPYSRTPRRNAVVVDIDDEDPAFEELGEPGPPAYRRAVGE